jgi:hypothetical protein
LGDDVGDEAHDGGFFVDGFFLLFLGLGRDVAFVAIVEGAGADAEVFDDELVDALGHGEVPDERARREGASQSAMVHRAARRRRDGAAECAGAAARHFRRRRRT